MDPSFDDRAEAQRQATLLLFRNAGTAFFGNTASALLVAYVNGPPRGMTGIAATWCAGVVLLAAMRFAIARRRRIDRPGIDETMRGRRRYVAATVLLAVCWALGGVRFLWGAPENLRLLNGMVLAGIVAGGMPILAPAPLAFRLFALIVCLPTAAVELAQASAPLDWVFGAVALVLPLAMIASARNLHATLDDLIRMGLQKSRAVEALRSSEARIREIIDYSPIGMGIAAPDGRFLQVNQAMRTMLGYGPGEIERLTILEITHADDRASCAQEHGELLAGRTPHFQLEKRFLRKDGSVIWAQVTASLLPRSGDAPACILGQIEDITERRMWREQVYHDAYYDPLTDLPNRRLLLDQANQALAEAQRRGRSSAMLYVDVDHFKAINDSLGHDAGDQMLREVAGRLKANVRRGDIVSRRGGDEFVIVLTDLEQPGDAARVARKILDAFAVPIPCGRGDIGVTISIGISLYPDDVGAGAAADAADDVEELIDKADAAMYAAKLQGRGSYRHFHEAVGALGHLTVLRGRGGGRAPRLPVEPT